ncbi:MAG: T9SS type A sorting domain-containing protein [Bacteroidia bacterium]|nr:T9SS type A sorting domain-containing protein [Bacteroidia bacterium]
MKKYKVMISPAKTAFYVFMFLPFSLIAQDWVLMEAFMPQQTLHSIRFANDSVGYTVSSLYNGTTFNIHKTADRGKTWIDQSSGYTATRFKDIWTFSEDTVMMCGNYGLVIHTTNGGEEWIADTVSPAGDHLFGIYFVGQTGYVSGNSGAIYKTTNMGDTWIKVDPPFITAIEEIYFLDENYGFIGGLNFIYFTVDGGQTWQQPQTFPGATTNWWLREFSFVTDSVGYVCADIGQIYKTTDKGKNWEYMANSPTTESLQAMIALDEENLYACGYTGTVMHSTDGAQSWEIMTAASQQNFNSIDFTPDGTGYICTYIGEVLRYVDPYLPVNESVAEEVVHVYPNPATDQINFSINGGVNISQKYQEVTILNSRGICLGTFPVGEPMSVSGLSPGIYLLIFTGKGEESQRKLIIKQ